MHELLTVCIPTRNRPELLREALCSVLEKINPRLRIVVGDNGGEAANRVALESVLCQFPLARIEHMVNPPGSTYVYNLQRLVDAVETPWLSILHDDDFFVWIPATQLIEVFLSKGVQFVYSDHWLADNNGELLREESEKCSMKYGRSGVASGVVENLVLNAVRQNICLDGFFIKTDLAKSVRFDLSYKVFSDSKWLFQVADLRPRSGYYFHEKVFAYRITANSLTAQTLDRLEFMACLGRLRLDNAAADAALRDRLRRLIIPAAKQAICSGRIGGFSMALWAMRRPI